MEKKMMAWKTKGMNRDLSVSAFNPEFAFENMNLRLATNEGNTMMSWVNERGTEEVTVYEEPVGETPSLLTIEGMPIGEAVINHKLVVFTHEKVNTAGEGEEPVWENRDRIYVFRKGEEDVLLGKRLFNGNLSFDAEHPLETLVSYEAEDVQKVYWTDGLNQPRMVNVVADYANYTDASFDFVPTLQLQEDVRVKKVLGGNGSFPAGVIQYAFTYYNKYGQESNIFYTTPLLYTSHRDRGAAPDEVVDNVFEITVNGVDLNFDYLRIYSIQRTSLNGTPIVKRVRDLELQVWEDLDPQDLLFQTLFTDIEVLIGNQWVPIAEAGLPEDSSEEWYEPIKQDYPDLKIRGISDKGVMWHITWGSHATDVSVLWISKPGVIGIENLCAIEECEDIDSSITEPYFYLPITVRFTDTGTSGNIVDPTELLYKGGESVVVETMEQKDGTLFMGNLEKGRMDVESYLSEEERAYLHGINISNSTRKIWPTKVIPVTVEVNPITLEETISEKGNYVYYNQLTSYENSADNQMTDISTSCAGFKRGNYYRCGVQFQYKTGKWSDPIYISDQQIAYVPTFPAIADLGQKIEAVSLPTLTGKLLSSVADALWDNGYRKVRAVVVYPNSQDKVVLSQGVLNPTLFTDEHRTYETLVPDQNGKEPGEPEYITTLGIRGNEDLYAQSSWFFRFPIDDVRTSPGGTDYSYGGGAVSPKAGVGALRYTQRNIAEDNPDASTPISTPVFNPEYIRQVEIQGEYNEHNKFQIDRSTVTLHTPDLCFDDSLYNMDLSGVELWQVGSALASITYSDIDIQTETPTISNGGNGFIHKAFKKKYDNLADEPTIGTEGIVSGLFYDDFIVDDAEDESGHPIRSYKYERSSCKWLVYLWNKNGSLNNDINRPSDKGVQSAVLKKKVISNLRFASTNLTTSSGIKSIDLENKPIPQIYASDESAIVKLGDHIYKGNIDTLLNPDGGDGCYFAFDGEKITDEISSTVNQVTVTEGAPGSEYKDTSFLSNRWWKTFAKTVGNTEGHGVYKWTPNQTTPANSAWVNEEDDIGDEYSDLVVKKGAVRMKYKSTPHIIFEVGNTEGHSITWANQQLPIAEIRHESNMFGGDTKDALKENVWMPCGEPVSLKKQDGGYVQFEYTYGDTYFQRWDCLKTYAFTPEDVNQVVEIGSFMLETYVNIDGRYDRNRGQVNNLNMSPRNFNLLNPVYSQLNNFFQYRIMDEDDYKRKSYPNQITWSKTKENGADVDLWTNVTLASILELDGDKGAITKLARLNDSLLAFQDTGIAQVLYNERAQVATADGVPIELANSGKVEGKRYVSDTIGCSNKWSIVNTPMGIYFMDSHDKSIQLFNGRLNNVSLVGGFNSWCKQEIELTENGWNPVNFDDFVGYYDKLNQDVLWINKEKALAYSEKIGAFTSFYDYGHAPYFCNLDDWGLWINQENGDEGFTGNYKIWRHQKGDYGKFFGKSKPYWMTLVGNPEPQRDKTFTNLEFRACVEGDGVVTQSQQTQQFRFNLPFDELEVWDEYQHGKLKLQDMSGYSPMRHGGDVGTLNRKFRIWRCDVPRDNVDVDSETEAPMGITRFAKRPLDRMRNPWMYLKLMKNVPSEETDVLPKVEVHDMMMSYFV